MRTPLNASATTAGSLMSDFTFEIPQYQREYSWGKDQVSEFWLDLQKSLHSESYFLGLVILTEGEGCKHVVDGQQRILTLSLLAAALYHEAIESDRKALAERIQADFLCYIDYKTDETRPRVNLSDTIDNQTFQKILISGEIDQRLEATDEESIALRLQESFSYLRGQVKRDLAQDPFKRLGLWADFITNQLYFAVFIHPDSADAYRVFEVINTRGLELTTADLLKNYLLGVARPQRRESLYNEWQNIARPFSPFGSNAFVQFIRHVVTVHAGHILPKDLFDFLARRTDFIAKEPPTSEGLVQLLQQYYPLYMQMNDTTLDGPADTEVLKIFSALNSLNVIAVRPILLAISNTPDALEGMQYILKLVVRRMVVGSLGTGNVERRFGEAAKLINDKGEWHSIEKELRDLNPSKDDFTDQLSKRSLNKGTLAFVRRSIISNEITPDEIGVLHFIMPRQQDVWDGISEEDAQFWSGTIANTFMAALPRRPKEANSWDGFKETMLPEALAGEWNEKLTIQESWNTHSMEVMGRELAEAAANVWY